MNRVPTALPLQGRIIRSGLLSEVVLSWSTLAVLPLTVVVADVAHAATEVETVVQAIEAKYEDVNVLQAGFVQVTKSSVFGDERQEGKVVLKRPAKMRWEFTSGEGKQFITDGQTMWIYTKADNQVIRYADITGASSSADNLLQSLDKLGEVFNVTLDPKVPEDGNVALVLVPREAEAQVKKLRLVLSDSYVVQHLTVVDGFDNTTELTFNSVKLNGEAPDELFQFEVPSGVELIDSGSL